MSRVSYVMMNPGGDAELTRAVREAVDALIGEAANEAGVARGEILEVTLVGNPIMHHLVLGLDPTELGGAPFALTIDGAFEARAREPRTRHRARRLSSTRCPASPAMSARTPPASCSRRRPICSDELTLIVDVGTNAEIVFGNQERLLACSSPTGPAFEGAQISCGQRAAPGRDRARAHRPRDAGAALQGDRLRSVVRRAGLCGGGRDARRHRRLRLRHHRGDRRDVLAGIIGAGRRDRRRARRAKPAHRGGRPHLRLCAERGRAAAAHLSDRRARHPARQGRALRGREAADRAARRRRRSASRSPAPSAAISTRPMRWCSA